MCNKCGHSKCCCKRTVISRKGIAGKASKGKVGPPGPPGPVANFEQVVGQSAGWGAITGNIGTTGVGTTFNNLASNFFVNTPKFFTISVGFLVTAPSTHTLKCYFRKNGVQVGPTYERTLQMKDYVIFQTDLIQFSNADALDLYVETTLVDGVSVSPGHLINYRII